MSRRKEREIQLQGAEHLVTLLWEKLENGTTCTKDLMENRDKLVLSGVQREAGSERDS